MQSESIAVTACDTRGKHRITAELKRLEQESRVLEEELEKLEKSEKASASCKEMSSVVETKPDPLLPTTNGPTSPLGIDGLKVPKIYHVAAAGYFERPKKKVLVFFG